ncbi:MAG: hypothetical protein U1F63_01785 [Chitinivorax sp.]
MMVAQLGTNWGILKLVNQDGIAASVALRTLVARICVVCSFGCCGGRERRLAFLMRYLGDSWFAIASSRRGQLRDRAVARVQENRAITAYAPVTVTRMRHAVGSFAGVLKQNCQLLKVPVNFDVVGSSCFGFAASSGILLLRSGLAFTSDCIQSGTMGARCAMSLPLLAAALLAAVLNSVDRFVVERFVAQR